MIPAEYKLGSVCRDIATTLGMGLDATSPKSLRKKLPKVIPFGYNGDEIEQIAVHGSTGGISLVYLGYRAPYIGNQIRERLLAENKKIEVLLRKESYNQSETIFNGVNDSITITDKMIETALSNSFQIPLFQGVPQPQGYHYFYSYNDQRNIDLIKNFLLEILKR